MDRIKILAFVAIAAFAMAPGAPKAAAQVTVDVGVAPDCPYGYYDYAPYNCVPDGYYGAEWFNSGIFIGAGPWFHGATEFQGHVNNRYHPEHGYKGRLPERGEKAEPTKRVSSAHFKGNEMRDGRGHVAEGKR